MNAKVTSEVWPVAGTKVECWCGEEAEVIERPPAGPLENTPPTALCPKRGHLAMRDESGRWRDAYQILLERAQVRGRSEVRR